MRESVRGHVPGDRVSVGPPSGVRVTTRDPLEAIRDRLGRADEHFETVKEMANTYFNSDRYHYAGDLDLSTSRLSVTSSVEFPDPRLSTVVGELVHDLRS